MTREQAIFFEILEDFAWDGSLEPMFFAYHDFISGIDFTTLSDLEVHRRAKDCLRRYEGLYDHCFYDLRWDILEQLDLEDAEWEGRDQNQKGEISVERESI